MIKKKEEQKYYLILQCRQEYKLHEGIFLQNYSYCITDESIVQYILDEAKSKIEKKAKHDYIVMNYWEITKEEYELLEDYYG